MNCFNPINMCALLLMAFLTCACSLASDPFPEIDLPVYQDSVNIYHAVNEPAEGSKIVSYYNAIPFPANDLIAFYDKTFETLGYVPFSEDGYGQHRWENFSPKSGEWELTTKAPARYIATWTDGAKSVRVVLSMRYGYRPNRKDEIGDLLVSCTVSPFFDSRKIVPPDFTK